MGRRAATPSFYCHRLSRPIIVVLLATLSSVSSLQRLLGTTRIPAFDAIGSDVVPVFDSRHPRHQSVRAAQYRPPPRNSTNERAAYSSMLVPKLLPPVSISLVNLSARVVSSFCASPSPLLSLSLSLRRLSGGFRGLVVACVREKKTLSCSSPLVTLATVAGATVAPSVVGRLGNVGAQVGYGCVRAG